MTNKILTIFVVVFAIGVISMIGVYAYRGDPNIQGPNYNEAVHEQLESAIEAGDYDAWVKIRQENNLPMNGRMFQVINKANFNKFVEMHDANLAGDTDKADEIRSSLGLGQGMMKGKMQAGQGCNMKGTGNMNCGKLVQGKTNIVGNGQGQTNQFIDSDNNGICDNYALHHQQN